PPRPCRTVRTPAGTGSSRRSDGAGAVIATLGRYRADGHRLTALATPIALTQLAQIAVSTTNIALMGTLGVAQLAAGGLAMVLFNQIRTMCVGLITGSGNQIAAAVGAAGKSGSNADGAVRDVVRSSFLIATGA